MVLKLYGMAMSTCTRRVIVTLKEKNVEYELIPIDLGKGEHKAPGFMEKQPFGQIPYIVEDDGFTLYESRAIARYIATKYADQGTPLIPIGDLKKTALFEQAYSTEVSNFDPSASGVVYQRYFAPMHGAATDEAVAAKHISTLEAKLEVYEKILSKQKYLAGDEISLADLSHLSYGTYLAFVKVDVLTSGKFPAVTAWWEGLYSRPSWQATIAK